MVYEGDNAVISPTRLEIFLEELPWPATKDEVLAHASEHGAPEEYLQELVKLPETNFDSAAHVFATLINKEDVEGDDLTDFSPLDDSEDAADFDAGE